MTEKAIHYIKQEHIATIIFNAKGGLETNRELAEISASINGDEDIYVVIISAEGSFFQQSADLSPSTENKPLYNSPAEAIGAINRPTIAALNGDACGVGLEIALACDMRIAVEGAGSLCPKLKMAAFRPMAGTQRLARLVGKGKAMEMILTGDPIEAVEALEIGLVNRVVKAESLTSEVEALAAALVTKAPLAMRYW